MANFPLGSRDRLGHLGDMARKTLRRSWLVVLCAVIGGALAFGFAIVHGRSYQSWAVLFYQERIQSNLLSNRQEEVQRNIGDRYRELLLAHQQLEQIVADPELDPFPKVMDPELAVDKLRNAIHFETRGANAFRITYDDTDPARAKAVTDRLLRLLQDKDEALRNDQAQATVSFATQQKEEAGIELSKREQALAEFLAKHPEFAQDPNQQNEGASIPAIRNQKAVPTGNNRLYALERQRQRIQARLDASPDAAPVRVIAPPSPEKIAAEAVVNEAQHELASAQRELDDATSKYTDKHPAMVKAQERVAAAQQKLRHAQAAVPPDVETAVAPATPADREKLQKELEQIDGQVNLEQRSNHGAPVAPADATTNWVVQLETKHADLRRAVAEQRGRVEALAEGVFRSQMDANQKLAETGGRLTVVDPAFKPVKPSGPGKTIFVLAGVALFVTIGLAIAIALALIDDRLYRARDLDPLGIAVLAVVPAARSRRKERA